MHRAHPSPLLLLTLAAPTYAQPVQTRALTKPEVEFVRPFSELTSIRELRDGRVVVVDGRELKVQLVDFRTGTAVTVGRTGEGPGEYRWPSRLYALAGDSSVVMDAAGGRLILITPDGKTTSFPDINRPGETSPGARFNLRFSDASGRLYAEAQPIRIDADGSATLADSSAIERFDRRTGKRDTVAHWPLRKDANARLMNGMVMMQPKTQPFPAWDQWLVAPDGRVAFVYYEPYRVDFAAPNEPVVRGKPIPYDRVKVDDALKLQYREDRQRPAMAMQSSRSGGTTIGPLKMPFKEPDSWPEFLPPYLNGPHAFSLDGILWIKRATAAGVVPTFDLIGANGALVGHVTLPQRAKLVGFGNGTVYLVRSDDDDLQYLQRYRLVALK